jgi:hypothetical protein
MTAAPIHPAAARQLGDFPKIGVIPWRFDCIAAENVYSQLRRPLLLVGINVDIH